VLREIQSDQENTMPNLNINLNWLPTYASFVEPRVDDNWIYDVTWRQNNQEIARDPGLYVIETGRGRCLYVGQAGNWFERFAKRNRVLREFRLAYPNTNPVDGYSVRLAEVNPVNAISTAENWLVRILFLRQKARSSLLLQNIRLVWEFQAEADIVITNTNRPGYLQARYQYSEGEKI
jgi:hypothetical protein